LHRKDYLGITQPQQ